MGVFGTGLYSGDFAMDLRSMVGAVCRLPFSSDRLVEVLCEAEAGAAGRPEDEDHSTFWFVVADQLAKHGVDSARARETALRLIDSGADLAMMEKLGMKAADLRKRGKMLEELRARLAAPVTSKKRKVLKTPQKLLMEVGEVFVYPTCAGNPMNPYFASIEKTKIHKHRLTDGTECWGWKQDGWAALAIVDRGLAFDYLAWYRPLTVSRATAERPTLQGLRRELLWKLSRPGTCSAIHMKRMMLEKIGRVEIDAEKFRRAFPDLRPGTNSAVNDISMANGMNVGPSVREEMMPLPGEVPKRGFGRPYPTLFGLGTILAG